MPSSIANCLNVGVARVRHDQLTHRVGHAEDLVHTDPFLVARAGAEVAAPAVEEVRLGRAADLLVERELVGRRLVLDPALAADPAHEALADDGQHRRRDEEGLDSHVEEPVQRGRGVGCVQRREHEVAGEGGLHGDARGLDVTDLADEDHVGVLAQDRLQPAGERDLGDLVDLDLVDRGEHVLDRVLDRHDVALDRVDLGERRVERRGLAGTGRAGADHHAERRADELGEDLVRRLGHPQLARAGRASGSCRGRGAPSSRRRSRAWSTPGRRSAARRSSSRTGRPARGDARRCSCRS